MAAHLHAPLIGLGLSLLAEPIGVWCSYAAGLSIGIGWNALLWGQRIWRQRATQNEGVSSQTGSQMPDADGRGNHLVPTPLIVEIDHALMALARTHF